MPAKRFIYILLIAASLVGALLWRTEQTPVDRASKYLNQTKTAPQATQSAQAQTTPEHTPPAQYPKRIPPEKLDHILKCFPDLDQTAQQDFQSVVEALVHELASDEQTLLHHDVYHLRLPDGQERRLRLYSERGVERLQFFSLDADGDPVLEEIPSDDHMSPDRNVIEKYLAQGDVIYREKSYDYKLLDKGELTIIEINGRIVDFNVKTAQVFLGCNQDACYCDNQ